MEHDALASETMNCSRPIPHDVVAKIVASKKRRDNSRSIPHDVMFEILSRVPGRSLVRLRCVCKLWGSFLLDSHFISLQLNHAAKNPSMFFGYFFPNRLDKFGFYSFEIEAGKGVHGNEFTVSADTMDMWRVSNACNGFIAFYGLHCAHVVNPCTRESMAISFEIEDGYWTSSLYSFLGLGFSTGTGKHKLVQLFSRNGRKSTWKVLTLGTDRSWRSLGRAPYRVVESQPTYANGCIYWTIDARHYKGPERILSFNVDQEEFMVIRPPQCHLVPNGAAYHRFSMSVLEGSVCAVDWRLYVDDEIGYYSPVMRIHVLMNHEADSVWTERHIIRFKRIRVHTKYGAERDLADNSMFPIAIQNGKVLLYRPNGMWKLHDLHTSICSKIKSSYPEEVKQIWNLSLPFVCEESIVPIDSLKN